MKKKVCPRCKGKAQYHFDEFDACASFFKKKKHETKKTVR